MLRKILSLFFASFFFVSVHAQELLGLGTGNYGGVAGMSLNPASIVDSRIKFDLNLIGISNYYSNNYLSVKRNALINGSFFKSRYKDWSLVQRDLLEENSLRSNERVHARLNNNVMVPLSFMASLNEKSAIALTINSRTNVMLNNVNQDFARLFYNNFSDPSLFNSSINMSGVSADILNWLDVGFTFGHVLLDQNEHFLKAAFTGKYIGGVASGYMESDNMWLDFSEKNEFWATTAHTQYGHSNKLSTDMFRSATLKSLRPEAEGFGWNAGLVYEYRGNIDRHKYITPENKERNRRDVNKYAFRLGVSIMDAGRLRFNKGGNNNDFTADITRWNLNSYRIKNIQDVDNMLADHVDYVTTAEGNYTVALPTALSAQLDLHLGRGFYLNAMTYQPVSLVNADRYMGVEPMYAITPRFESRTFGFYVPVSYNEFDKWNLGATLRLGPIYVGSSNLASLVFNDKVRTADIHAGVRIPIAHGSKTKVAKFYDKLTQKKQEDSVAAKSMKQQLDSTYKHNDSLDQARQQIQLLSARLQELEKQRIIDSMRLLMNTQQPVVTPPVNIFINNYPSDGGRVSIDSILSATKKVEPATPAVKIQDSSSKKMVADTAVKKVVIDSTIIRRYDTVTIPTSIAPAPVQTQTVMAPVEKRIFNTEPPTEESQERQDTQAALLNAGLQHDRIANRAVEQDSIIQRRLNNLERQHASVRTRDSRQQEVERRSTQQRIERQQQQIREMERELARLRTQTAVNRSAVVQQQNEGDSQLGPVTPEKKKFRPFAFLKKKEKDEETVPPEITEDTLYSQPQKRGFRPFAFLKKKDKEGIAEEVTEEEQTVVKKKFRPFAFLKKKDDTTNAEQVAGEETTVQQKKTFRPFAFLRKKSPENNDSTVVAEETEVKKKKSFRPFAFLKKKDKNEPVETVDVTESKPKKKWNPFGFLKKKKKDETVE